MKYELDLYGTNESTERVLDLIRNLDSTIRLLNDDSFRGVNGGAGVHYNLEIKVKEEWI